MSEFLKNIFTLRTVWIDRGNGKWTVRKRLHPFMKGVLFVLSLSACGIIYVTSGKDLANNSQAAAKTTEQNFKPVNDNKILIPLKNFTSKTEIILPSEQNPEIDRIIPPVEKPKVQKPVNNGKFRITISKSNHILSLLQGDELIKEYSIAVGKNTGDKQRVGDNRTPVGNFKIISIENASSWKHDFRDGKGKISGAYGPWFLRLDAKGWKGIGIHGTHDPDSRGTNATEGCIRLSNEDIAELKQYAYKNMPVTISE